MTINPQTGLPEAGFLSAMLPMLASAAAVALAPATMGASTVALLGAGAGADALNNPAINLNTSDVYVVGENVLK